MFTLNLVYMNSLWIVQCEMANLLHINLKIYWKLQKLKEEQELNLITEARETKISWCLCGIFVIPNFVVKTVMQKALSQIFQICPYINTAHIGQEALHLNSLAI